MWLSMTRCGAIDLGEMIVLAQDSVGWRWPSIHASLPQFLL
jgi:hypothetical protein